MQTPFTMDSSKPTIAVLGGTGKEGSGLAFRWAHAGYPIILGSRAPDKAIAAADAMRALVGGGSSISGGSNDDSARAATIVVLAVPFSAQMATAVAVKESLRGKILIDVTVPLVPPKVDRVQLPAGGSAVAALQLELGADIKVVSAFQNVSSTHLKTLSHSVDCDVLVCGDDADAREVVVQLARDAGMTGWHAGPLANSAASEALTSVLIAINKRYKVPGAGIRITGVPR